MTKPTHASTAMIDMEPKLKVGVRRRAQGTEKLM
jgi:hypothetical protein